MQECIYSDYYRILKTSRSNKFHFSKINAYSNTLSARQMKKHFLSYSFLNDITCKNYSNFF